MRRAAKLLGWRVAAKRVALGSWSDRLNMTRLLAPFLATIITGLPVAAQTVAECDWRAAAQALPEPWEAYTRTFANGAIRMAVMDVIEPAAGPMHLLVLSPPLDETGGRQCRIISLQDTFGFAGLRLDLAQASYDPARGLAVSVPATRWLSDSDSYLDGTLTTTINQATGEIFAWMD